MIEVALEVLVVDGFAYEIYDERLKRRDYELMIISRLLVYGSVDDERSVLEVSLALSLAYQERCLV